MSIMSDLNLKIKETCRLCTPKTCPGCVITIQDKEKNQTIKVNGWSHEVIGVYDK
jgi:hypothetical protein